MAKPRKKLPAQSITVSCKKCRAHLFDYRKGGKGALVKSFLSRITKDSTEQKGICPNCGSVFGRETLVRGEPAIKFVGGKVYWK